MSAIPVRTTDDSISELESFSEDMMSPRERKTDSDIETLIESKLHIKELEDAAISMGEACKSPVDVLEGERHFYDAELKDGKQVLERIPEKVGDLRRASVPTGKVAVSCLETFLQSERLLAEGYKVKEQLKPVCEERDELVGHETSEVHEPEGSEVLPISGEELEESLTTSGLLEPVVGEVQLKSIKPMLEEVSAASEALESVSDKVQPKPVEPKLEELLATSEELELVVDKVLPKHAEPILGHLSATSEVLEPSVSEVQPKPIETKTEEISPSFKVQEALSGEVQSESGEVKLDSLSPTSKVLEAAIDKVLFKSEEEHIKELPTTETEISAQLPSNPDTQAESQMPNIPEDSQKSNTKEEMSTPQTVHTAQVQDQVTDKAQLIQDIKQTTPIELVPTHESQKPKDVTESTRAESPPMESCPVQKLHKETQAIPETPKEPVSKFVPHPAPKSDKETQAVPETPKENVSKSVPHPTPTLDKETKAVTETPKEYVSKSVQHTVTEDQVKQTVSKADVGVQKTSKKQKLKRRSDTKAFGPRKVESPPIEVESTIPEAAEEKIGGNVLQNASDKIAAKIHDVDTIPYTTLYVKPHSDLESVRNNIDNFEDSLAILRMHMENGNENGVRTGFANCAEYISSLVDDIEYQILSSKVSLKYFSFA